MPYTINELSNSYKLFEVRTREVRTRIQNLELDLTVAKSIITQAIIINELDKITDDYVERKSLLERTEETNDDFAE